MRETVIDNSHTPVIVSACLAGVCCRYDGRDALSSQVKERMEAGECITLCPEELGGLDTPRPRARIEAFESLAVSLPQDIDSALCQSIDEVGGGAVFQGKARVRTEGGVDVTEAFISGAIEVAREAVRCGVRSAYLKTQSPSCDSELGVTAALLKGLGIRIFPTDRDREEGG